MTKAYQSGNLPRNLMKEETLDDGKKKFKVGVWYALDPFDITTWPPMRVRLLIERDGFAFSPCYAVRMTETMYGLALYPKSRYRPVAEITRFQLAPVSRSDMAAKRKMEVFGAVYGEAHRR